MVHAVVDEGDGTDAFCLPPPTPCPSVAQGPGQRGLLCGGHSGSVHTALPHTRVPKALRLTSGTPLGSITCPCRDGSGHLPEGRNQGRSVDLQVYCLVFSFTRVPFFLSEYFGHCHVLLGTFEKVREWPFLRASLWHV